MTSAARHRFLEHTGEVEVHIEAPDLASLLEEAAHALAELMSEDAGGPSTESPERIELAAADRETLLVDWLDELVFRSDVAIDDLGDVRVDRATERTLAATVRGRAPSSPRTAVKAATWHRLSVRDTPNGLEATVVLDV
jgi:SHS2 domain-containing protein